MQHSNGSNASQRDEDEPDELNEDNPNFIDDEAEESLGEDRESSPEAETGANKETVEESSEEIPLRQYVSAKGKQKAQPVSNHWLPFSSCTQN